MKPVILIFLFLLNFSAFSLGFTEGREKFIEPLIAAFQEESNYLEDNDSAFDQRWRLLLKNKKEAILDHMLQSELSQNENGDELRYAFSITIAVALSAVVIKAMHSCALCCQSYIK